jgi:hypothetical protein
VINHIFEFKTLIKIVLLMEVTICKMGGDFLPQGIIKEGTVAKVYGNYGAKARIDSTS